MSTTDEAKGRSWKVWFDVGATVVMMAAAGILAWKAVAAPVPGAGKRGVLVPTELQSLEAAPTKGSPQARVGVIEYSDFQCPYCGRFAREVFPQINQTYIATGKLRIVFRHVPLTIHQNARGAAEAAVCAEEQGKFWPFHDTLFAHPEELDSASLLKHAASVGIQLTSYRACVVGMAGKRVRADEEAATALGIHGTPTFLIGAVRGSQLKVSKVLAGAAPFAEFAKAIDLVLAKGGD